MESTKNMTMGRTRIKVCGMTDPLATNEIIKMGVDAIGFIFVQNSPRTVEPEKVYEIIKKVPPFVDTVGVFMNEDPDLVNDIVQYCGLTMVQLHGTEPPEYCQSINCRTLKAVRVQGTTSLSSFEPYFDVVNGFLLDTFDRQAAGGTGKTFDWKMVPEWNLPLPVVLAGGLSPDNVLDAIGAAQPYAVDVNSGVEVCPGVKDLDKVQVLVNTVNSCMT